MYRDRALELRVHKIVQTSSGGNHVTIYDAEVDIVPAGSEVQVLGIQNPDAFPGDVEAAIEAIRRGAQRVLRPLGLGAIIHVRRIVLHPVDFKARKFEQYTIEELQRLMADSHS